MMLDINKKLLLEKNYCESPITSMHFLVLSACSKLPAKHRARQYQPAHSNPFHKAEVTLLMPGFSGKMADAGRAAVLHQKGTCLSFLTASSEIQ